MAVVVVVAPDVVDAAVVEVAPLAVEAVDLALAPMPRRPIPRSVVALANFRARR